MPIGARTPSAVQPRSGPFAYDYAAQSREAVTVVVLQAAQFNGYAYAYAAQSREADTVVRLQAVQLNGYAYAN